MKKLICIDPKLCGMLLLSGCAAEVPTAITPKLGGLNRKFAAFLENPELLHELLEGTPPVAKDFTTS